MPHRGHPRKKGPPRRPCRRRVWCGTRALRFLYPPGGIGTIFFAHHLEPRATRPIRYGLRHGRAEPVACPITVAGRSVLRARGVCRAVRHARPSGHGRADSAGRNRGHGLDDEHGLTAFGRRAAAPGPVPCPRPPRPWTPRRPDVPGLAGHVLATDSFGPPHRPVGVASRPRRHGRPARRPQRPGAAGTIGLPTFRTEAVTGVPGHLRTRYACPSTPRYGRFQQS